MIPVLSLLGCSDDPAPPAPAPVTGTTPELEPSPWEFETTAAGDPPVDLALLGRVLDTALVEVLRYEAAPVVDGYTAILTQSSTPGCPVITLDPYGNVYWSDGCTAPDGTYFGGYLSEYHYDYVYDDDAGVYLDGLELSGNVALTVPDGTYDLEGYATWIEGSSPDGLITFVESVLIGGFSFDSPSASGWLSDAGSGMAVNTTLIGYNIADVALAVIVAGSVLVEVDGKPYSVAFDTAQLGDEGIGSLCADEPGGVVRIRDPYGRWFEATFDGPDLLYGTALGDPDRCEGCADTTLDGEPVGQICTSFDPWYQWERIR